jgi:hypothetical protein
MIDETPADAPEPGSLAPAGSPRYDTGKPDPGAPSGESQPAEQYGEPAAEAGAGVPIYTAGSADQDATVPQPVVAPPSAGSAPEVSVPPDSQPEPDAREQTDAPGTSAQWSTYAPAATAAAAGAAMSSTPANEVYGAPGGFAAAAMEPGSETQPEAVQGDGVSAGAKRALVIGGLAAALLVVLGLAVLAGLFAFGMFPSRQTGITTTSGSGTPSTSSTGTAKPPGAAQQSAEVTAAETSPVLAVVSNADVYESRDPFAPLLDVLAPASTSTSAETTSSSGSTSTTTAPSSEASGTLTLVAIVTEDGVRKAKLTLDGKAYTVPAGSRVDSTPWQVLEVGSDNAVMLFGDERITLFVGQGVSK